MQFFHTKHVTPARLQDGPNCRRMIDSDVADVAEIDENTFEMPLSAKAIVHLWGEPNTYAYVSTTQRVVAAYAIITHYDDFIEIRRMATDPGFRGDGHGCCLIAQLQERVRSMPPMHCLAAFVDLGDLDSLEFFKRRGFRATTCVDWEGHDLVAMEWHTN